MPELIVLSDAVSHDILVNLRADDIIAFKDEISQSLVQFSITDERRYQPEPGVVTRPDGRRILFRPFTSTEGPGIKIVVDPTTPSASEKSQTQSQATNKSEKKPTLHGIIAVSDEDGLPKGLINADEITAYRTSMSVMIPFAWRSNTANILVFGAGKTAMWHVRLALGLRGHEIKRIAVVNRTRERAQALIQQVQAENQKIWKSAAQFQVLSHENSNYKEALQEELLQADVVFCTTPSSRPLFTASSLLHSGERRRSCFVSGIGSWQPDMVELDPDLLREATVGADRTVIVDDREGALKSSGEIVQSGLASEQIMELGELLGARDRSHSSLPKEVEKCLQDGLVVYKSVGVSLTDLAAANMLLRLAKRQDRGVLIPDF